MASKKKPNNKNLMITSNQLLKELLSVSKHKRNDMLTEEQYQFVKAGRKGPVIISWNNLSKAFLKLGWGKISYTTLNRYYLIMKEEKGE